MNPYEVLGVAPDATLESIRAAYRALSKVHHPDKNDGRESQQWHEINNAHQVLTDQNQRFQYDQTGLMPGEDVELLNAINLIRSMFAECIHEGSAETNILEGIRRKIANKTTALEIQIKTLDANANHWKATRDRIVERWKPATSGARIKKAMIVTLEQSILQMDVQKIPLEQQLKVCRMANEQIAQDNYEMPMPEVKPSVTYNVISWQL